LKIDFHKYESLIPVNPIETEEISQGTFSEIINLKGLILVKLKKLCLS